jgi:hypothetical protein
METRQADSDETMLQIRAGCPTVQLQLRYRDRY